MIKCGVTAAVWLKEGMKAVLLGTHNAGAITTNNN